MIIMNINLIIGLRRREKYHSLLEPQTSIISLFCVHSRVVTVNVPKLINNKYGVNVLFSPFKIYDLFISRTIDRLINISQEDLRYVQVIII